MPRDSGEVPAVRVYTVCDESRYLIVRNVPALGCDDEVLKMFGSYGEIEECKPMNAEDCEPFTDVYWIKFSQVSNARFAKRKLDDSVFLGRHLQVSYAPQFESIADTKEKLEGRKKECLGRIKFGRLKGPRSLPQASSHLQHSDTSHQLKQAQNLGVMSGSKQREYIESGQAASFYNNSISHISSNTEYFSSPSMNVTVQAVREKLDKIKSSSEHLQAGPASKKHRTDTRRRI